MKNFVPFILGTALLSLVGLGCGNLFRGPRVENENANIYAGNQTNVNRASNVAAAAGDSNAATKNATVISGGVLNGKATNLVEPAYPRAAKAVRASGVVNVEATIDEKGDVVSATAANGHPLLRAAAVQAARASKFSPTILDGKPVKVTGVIVYNFSEE
jgi:TonB family protein